MESYKHSCPVCGQHVEYTAGYCGRQMQCPICGNTITFPAIPPSSGGKTVTVVRPKAEAGRAWKPLTIFASVRDFQHWNTIVQIAVPFLIIGALLAGAAFVKNKFSDEPAAAPAAVVEGTPGGWDKMTELARTDQKVQQDMQKIAQAKRAVVSAQMVLNAEQKRESQVHDSDERQALAANVQSYERSLNQAQNALNYWRQTFEADMRKYRNLGGTIDYPSQLQY